MLLRFSEFFGSINKTRITRALKALFPYKRAREYARVSVVRSPDHPSKWMLPFGFVQSPIIAALCYSKSALGRCVADIVSDKDVIITTYVDDLIVSAKDPKKLNLVLSTIKRHIEYSAFRLNYSKSQDPGSEITVFNIKLSFGSMMITDERMMQFRIFLKNCDNENQRVGVYNYVASVNKTQLIDLY